MHEQMERMARMEAAQQQQQQAHLDALRQQAADLRAAVAPLHAQGAVAVAAIARAHPHALRGLRIPQDASDGEQIAHHREGNRLEDAVMRTPYLEEVSNPDGNLSSGRPQPPPTAPDDALIRLMLPEATASVPPPFRYAGTPDRAQDDPDRVPLAARAAQQMLLLPETAPAAAAGRRPPREPSRPQRPADETRRAADEPWGKAGGSHGGNALRESLRGDSEWIFPPQEALNASLAPDSRLPSAAPPGAPLAAEPASLGVHSRGGLQRVAEEARSGGSLGSSIASAGGQFLAAGGISAPPSRPDSGRRRSVDPAGCPVSPPLRAATGVYQGEAVAGGTAGSGSASAGSLVASRESSRRAFTPGLDTLVRRAEDRLRQLQLSERTPEGLQAWQGKMAAPNGAGAGECDSYSAELLRQSMAADSAMCLPSDELPPLSAGAAPAGGTPSTHGACAYGQLQRLAGPQNEWGEPMAGAWPRPEGGRPISGGRRADAPTADRRPVASPALSDASSVGGGYTWAVGARTEAQLRRIAELERHLAGGGSAPPTAGASAGAAAPSRLGLESRGGNEAGCETLGGLASTRAMEERMRRLEALERELGPPSRGGGKEELDQLLSQWSGQGVA